MNKISTCEVKKSEISVQGTSNQVPSCDCKVLETIVVEFGNVPRNLTSCLSLARFTNGKIEDHRYKNFVLSNHENK